MEEYLVSVKNPLREEKGWAELFSCAQERSLCSKERMRRWETREELSREGAVV